MNDVIITQTDGGLGRRDRTEDMIQGFMTSGVAIVGGMQLNTTYEIKSLTQAENDLLITAAYDTTNKVVIHRVLKRFFKINPAGTVWLRVCAQATTMAAMVTNTNTHAKKLLQDAGGAIKVLFVSFNPATGYTPVLLTGLDKDVLDSVPLAKALRDAEFTAHRPVDIILEGKQFNGTASAALDIRSLSAGGVHICIHQDKDIAASDALVNKYADIGSIMGIVSIAKVHENIGWVQKFNIQDTIDEFMMEPYLSSNLPVSSYTDADLDTLNTKGYIFARKHVGIDGVYFNDSHSCTLVTSDYAYLENNRTINKASRKIRLKLLPQLQAPLAPNPATGMLAPQVCKYFEALGKQALDVMERDGEIVSKDVFVDPNQDILATSKIVVKHKIVPFGTARTIEAEIGFNNPSN